MDCITQFKLFNNGLEPKMRNFLPQFVAMKTGSIHRMFTQVTRKAEKYTRNRVEMFTNNSKIETT